MRACTRYVRDELEATADPDKAEKMAAYMKTDMPFFGVQAGARRAIAAAAAKRFPVRDRDDYEATVLDLWRRRHREFKYVAIAVARRHNKHVAFASIGLYERMIREGAWWDLVDEIATHLVGVVLLADPESMWPVLDAWIADDDLWIRRTAILAQNRHKERTDRARLFRYCLAQAHDTDFFMRKAIGWALRAYSYTAPDAVRAFVDRHADRLSGLTRREALKVIERA